MLKDASSGFSPTSQDTQEKLYNFRFPSKCPNFEPNDFGAFEASRESHLKSVLKLYKSTKFYDFLPTLKESFGSRTLERLEYESYLRMMPVLPCSKSNLFAVCAH